MARRQEVLVVNGATIRYSVSDLTAAEARIKVLRQEIGQIQATRGVGPYNSRADREARRQLRLRYGEINTLREVITAIRPHVARPVALPGMQEGTSLLDYARRCREGNPENMAHCGGMIAAVSEDEADLLVLEATWESFRDSSKPRPDLVAKLGCACVEALASLGRFEQAYEIVIALDPKERETAQAWLALASHGENQALDVARNLAHQGAPGARERLFREAYIISGNLDDAKEARPDPTFPVGRQRAGAIKLAMLRAHLGWDHLDQAREVAASLEDHHSKLHAQACIAEYTGTAPDLRLLLDLLDEYQLLTVAATRRVMGALVRGGHHNRARELLESLSFWVVKCAGYSALASLWEEAAHELLSAALASLPFDYAQGKTDPSLALYSLAYAQAMVGQWDQAEKTATQVRGRQERCKACLLITLLEDPEERSIPPFLTDLL